MGVIAQSIVAYAQPLIKRNSSMEQTQHAMMLAQICWNLSVMPDEKREARLTEIQKTLEFSDTDFNEFRKDVIDPMIQRHKEMFPNMRTGRSEEFIPSASYAKELPPKIGRNSPCRCNSGKKFKQCCGKPGSY